MWKEEIVIVCRIGSQRLSGRTDESHDKLLGLAVFCPRSDTRISRFWNRNTNRPATIFSKNSLTPFFVKYTESWCFKSTHNHERREGKRKADVETEQALSVQKLDWYQWRCLSFASVALAAVTLEVSQKRLLKMVVRGTFALLLNIHTLKSESVLRNIHNPSSVSKVGVCNYRFDDRIS